MLVGFASFLGFFVRKCRPRLAWCQASSLTAVLSEPGFADRWATRNGWTKDRSEWRTGSDTTKKGDILQQRMTCMKVNAARWSVSIILYECEYIYMSIYMSMHIWEWYMYISYMYTHTSIHDDLYTNLKWYIYNYHIDIEVVWTQYIQLYRDMCIYIYIYTDIGIYIYKNTLHNTFFFDRIPFGPVDI